jgi:hypothetical protein
VVLDNLVVLASVFTGSGGYTSPQSFVDGLIPAMWVGWQCSARALSLPCYCPSALPVQPRRPLRRTWRIG